MFRVLFVVRSGNDTFLIRCVMSIVHITPHNVCDVMPERTSKSESISYENSSLLDKLTAKIS